MTKTTSRLDNAEPQRRAATMPDEAMDVTRSWFDTWNRSDLDTFIDLYAVDAEVTPPPSWIEAGTLKGQPAIRRFFEGLKESWSGHDEAVLGELFRAGDTVVSRMDWQVRGRASGIETHIEVTNINTIVNGKIMRQRHYLDHAEALTALGLAE
jgi:ketosteroid isomerase-like protein